VVAVTASALGDARATARAAGCVDYLSKPIRAQELFGMLRLHLGVQLHRRAICRPATHRARRRPPRRCGGTGCAAQSRSATVTDIHALAGSLMRGTPAESALGERINRLVVEFDFAGLAELGDSLAGSAQP
jgi:CheY-like chemotaxis protein